MPEAMDFAGKDLAARARCMVNEPAETFLGRRPQEQIGFAIRDARGRSAAFQIDLDPRDGHGERQALVFGAESAVHIEGEGVLPAHFVVLPTEDGLVVATADMRRPAVLNGTPLTVAWTNLEIPSRIRVGNALVDFFYVRESGVVLVDQDIETTLCTTSVLTSARPIPPRPGRPALARPPAALAGPSALPPRGAAALEAHARRIWAQTPPSSRLLLGLVAVLLVVVVVR